MLVVGDVADDIVVRPQGVVTRDRDARARISRRAGGSAANQAAWLGSLGTVVTFVGRVGAEDVGRHTALLAAHGVDARLIGGGRTATVVVVVGGDGERTMFSDRGTSAELTLADVVGAVDLDGIDHLHLTGYSLLPPSDLTGLLDAARERGLRFSVDPGSAAFVAEFSRDRFRTAVADATGLLPNEAEARLLTGRDDPAAAAMALAGRSGCAVVTRGARGAVVASAGRVTAVPATRAECVDPTGAGDAFSAGFLHHWLAGADSVTAATAAGVVAAGAVTRVGARPPTAPR